MDMRFAKVAHHPDGRDCIYVEGVLVPLAIEDQAQNNILVDRIVRGLRQTGENKLTLCSGGVAPLSAPPETVAA
jgi:hypothetical protein